jgi:hypothetical protein
VIGINGNYSIALKIWKIKIYNKAYGWMP